MCSRQFMANSFALLLCGAIFVAGCGGGGGESGEKAAQGDVLNNTIPAEEGLNAILSEKLLGTPFEGMITGDDLGWCEFQVGEYLTDTPQSFPIPIFLAFFTQSEETEIKEGVAIANESSGETIFEVVDDWSIDCRLMYKVEKIHDPIETNLPEDFFSNTIGKALTLYHMLDGELSTRIAAVDWQIELRGAGINRWVVAHELGHAAGIRSHALINYQDGTLEDLEDNSLMMSIAPTQQPALNDYTFMMQKQKEIFSDYLVGASQMTSTGGNCGL